MKPTLSRTRPGLSLLAATAFAGVLALGSVQAQNYTGPRSETPAAQRDTQRDAQRGDGRRGDAQGRYAGPSSLSVTTVKQLLDQGRDDQKAMLRGRIVSWDGGKHYTFDDGTGQIRLEIKARRFPANPSIDDKTTVELYGELERKRRGVKFEVDQMRVVQ